MGPSNAHLAIAVFALKEIVPCGRYDHACLPVMEVIDRIQQAIDSA